MIPIKNKKKSFEDTVQEMRDFSMKYIEKYAPSKQQLRTYLLKKYLKFGAVGIKKNEIKDLIDVVLSDLENSKYLNDKFYSNSKAKNLIQRGSSINKIRNYLMSKGINQKFVKETLDKIKDENEDQDFFSALSALFDRKRSRAFSISPSHSTSAFLQSIIATPVISLNSFTCDALISTITYPFHWYLQMEYHPKVLGQPRLIPYQL